MRHPAHLARPAAFAPPRSISLALAAAAVLLGQHAAWSQVPSQSLLPQAAAGRLPISPVPPTPPPARCSAPMQCQRSDGGNGQAGPVHTQAPAAVAGTALPRYSVPPEPPLPDRERQILEMQLATHGSGPARALAPSEATAMWHGYTARIGKPPNLGAGSGAGSGGSGGSSGAAGQ